MNLLLDDLRHAIRIGEAVIVAGAGISIAATSGAPTASWIGLLEHGIARCEEVGSDVPGGWGDVMRDLLKLGDIDSMLSAAENVTSKLGGPSGGEYERWLRESVGALETVDNAVLEAVVALNVPLATTNYDGLLEDATGLSPATWRSSKVQRVIRGAERRIIHLHGHWEEPESVVLGIRSYATVLGDARAQAMQQALAVTKTLVFVGFGAGLGDPNFGAFRKWMAGSLRSSEYRQFRLVSESDVQRIKAEHSPNERVMIVSYGDELSSFLRALRPHQPTRAPSVQHDVAPSSLPAWRPCYGRDSIVEDVVVGVLRVPPAPTPVLGGPGIGKSTVARTVAHDTSVAERFGARRYWVRCDSTGTALALVSEIARVLGIPGGSAVGDRVLAALAARPALLVLDNAETPWIEDVTATEELLTQLSQVPGLALVASFRGTQRPLGPMWRSSIQVPPLAANDARALFVAVAGEQLATDSELDSLLVELDGMPIALELLAFQAQGEDSAASLRKRWEQQRTSLLQRGPGLDRHLSVSASLELSITSPLVSSIARRVLCLLGWLPDGIATDDVDDVTPGPSRNAVALLRDAGLAFVESGRLRTLKPIRDYVAVAHHPQPEDQDRTTLHYMGLATTLGDRILRDGGGKANARLAAETANLECVLSDALEGPNAAGALDAVHALTSFVAATGAPIDRLFDQAVRTAKHAADRDQAANALFDRGRIALARSYDSEADEWFNLALALHADASDVRGQAVCFRGLGEVALARWDHDAAVDRLGKARELFRKLGDVVGEATCLRGLGRSAQNHGDDSEARDYLTEALGLFKEADDTLGQATCLMRLGEITIEQENDSAAEQDFRAALPLYKEAGSVLGEANCLVGFGNVALVRAQTELAREQFAQALALYERVRERYSIGQTHRRLAAVAPDAQTRKAHRDAAIETWSSIGRPDLIERHFGQDGS